MIRRIGIIAGLLLLAAGSGRAPAAPPADAHPRLVVVVVVDQMRPDYLTRFDDLFTGGFRRLLDEGAVYLGAYHEHARTVTAAGHASIATGSYPSHHGIVGNSWYDRSRDNRSTYSGADDAQLVGEPGEAAGSPSQLLCDGLGDWLEGQSPQSRVFSVALKDRSAIIMGGRGPDGVYWYDRREGTFCTSTYYADAYPEWVRAFNDEKIADTFFAGGWRRSMPDSVYARSRPDSFTAEADGEHMTFPYSFQERFGAPGKDYYSWLRALPFGDALLLEFARRLVVEEDLGVDDAPDLLFVGCSAADGVGHTWGPFSVEAQDYYLRLDGYLASFFELLDERVGRGRYTVALSSDHGVLPMPEELERRGIAARRVLYDQVRADYERVSVATGEDLGLGSKVGARLDEGILIDYSGTDSAGIDRARVRAAFADHLRELPYVADVFTRDELAGGAAAARPYYAQYKRSFHPDRGPDLYVRLVERTLVTRGLQGTSHGSPYEYDTNVPIIFAGFGIAPGRHDEKVGTTAIAPTLARLLGLHPASVDGRAVANALSL